MTEYINSLRRLVGHMPLIMCGAAVIVYRDGQVLLQKRRDNGCWSIHGGMMEIGESLEETARRELFEETGLKAGQMTLHGVFSGDGMYYKYPNGDEVHNVSAVYICEDFSGDLAAEAGEVTELKWFSILDMPEDISPPVKIPLDSFIAEKKRGIADPCQSAGFWEAVDALMAAHEIVIDRVKGSSHPKYPDFRYLLDYGYIKGTTSMDGNGIDIWRGSTPDSGIDAVICTIDLLKNDSEIKLLIGCTEEEKMLVYNNHNDTKMMKGLLIRRPEK